MIGSGVSTEAEVMSGDARVGNEMRGRPDIWDHRSNHFVPAQVQIVRILREKSDVTMSERTALSLT